MKHYASRIVLCAGLIISMTMALPVMAAPVDGGGEGGKEYTDRPAVRATDWVAAWQAARQACPSGDTVTLTFVERSGLRSEMQKSAAGVDLAAFGELVVITVKVGSASVESVTVVRASDLIKVEITRKDGGARR